jgi:hypothetical protein
MRWRLLPACALLLGVVQSAAATNYVVGPGKPYAAPSDVPWEALAAGDSVKIHHRAAPYADKWVICRVGTEAAPIVVHGVPDPATGALPVIEGANAVTRPALNFWSEQRGVIKIGGANVPPDTQPAWIVVENLEIRGARSSNTFTGRSGPTSYSGNASAIYVEKGDHVTIRNCHLHDCGNGFFSASTTSELLVERCWIEGNGNVGSIYEHNNYTEAKGATFQFNRFGPLLAGAGGNNLKDRSAGCVIRYNWIEGGNRQLDLVESDYAELVDDPRYHRTFVYGNVLLETGDDGNSQVAHYGGDGGATANYRKGTLYFHANTIVSRRTGNTTLVRLSTDDESADVRDNVLYVTATGNRFAFLDQSGTLVATRNWLKTGWVKSHSGGNPSVADGGQLTGAAPGFTNQAGNDFTLDAASPCIDQGAPLLPACVPDHQPVFEYASPQSGHPRFDDGHLDLGAFERTPNVGVGPAPAWTGPRLAVSPNPFTFACDVRWIGGGEGAPGGELEVFDLAGRRVARVAPSAPGVWRWSPAEGTRKGVYFLRAPGTRPVAAYLR